MSVQEHDQAKSLTFELPRTNSTGGKCQAGQGLKTLVSRSVERRDARTLTK